MERSCLGGGKDRSTRDPFSCLSIEFFALQLECELHLLRLFEGIPVEGHGPKIVNRV